MISYPIISLPNSITSDITAESYVKEIIGDKPQEPSKPTKQKTHEGCLTGFAFFAIAAVVASGAIPLGTSLPVGLGITVVLWIMYSAMGQSEYSKNLRKYENDYSAYENELRNYSYAKIEAKKHLDNLIKKRDRSWRFQLIQKKLKENHFNLSSGYGKKGASEDYFIDYVKRFFQCKAYQNSPVKCNSIGATFYPDVILFFEKYNLAIAVEIDEPYKLKDREPIHYYNLENDIPVFVDDEIFTRNINSVFTSRTKEITNNGFILVRFAEKQIVDEPLACCKYIRDSIVRYTGIDIRSKNEFTIDDLTTINTWTYQEAKEMSRDRYRESYLSRIHL